VHSVADQKHIAAAIIVRHAQTDHQLKLVRENARQMVRFKIARFDGIYDALRRRTALVCTRFTRHCIFG
jgi:hypothetical protein